MENEKKNSSGVWSRVLIILGVVAVIFLSGYFMLDKLIVPHYFRDYGINGMGDLVGVINSLYKNPKEEQLLTNAYNDDDLQSAISKLKDSNYNIDDEGNIVIEDFNLNATNLELTDKEIAAISNKILKSDALDDVLQELNYIELDKISILEVIIDLDENSKVGEVYNSANLSFVAKLETSEMINQIEQQMETPKMLLNMIIPQTLYFSISYDIDLSKEANDRTSNGAIAINGRTEKQSEILINMLVDFIFPPEDGMNMHNFIIEFGNVILKGIDKLGEFKFKLVDNDSGILVSPQN